MPCTKPPSIWPMSMAGFSERPTSCRMSTRATFISPVSVSIATSGTRRHRRNSRRAGPCASPGPSRCRACGRSPSPRAARGRVGAACASSPKRMDLLPSEHAAVAEHDLLAAAPHSSAANAVMRSLMARAAIWAAMPLRSEPAEAAVGEALGTIAVLGSLGCAPSRAARRTPPPRPGRPSRTDPAPSRCRRD